MTLKFENLSYRLPNGSTVLSDACGEVLPGEVTVVMVSCASAYSNTRTPT